MREQKLPVSIDLIPLLILHGRARPWNPPVQVVQDVGSMSLSCVNNIVMQNPNPSCLSVRILPSGPRHIIPKHHQSLPQLLCFFSYDSVHDCPAHSPISTSRRYYSFSALVRLNMPKAVVASSFVAPPFSCSKEFKQRKHQSASFHPQWNQYFSIRLGLSESIRLLKPIRGLAPKPYSAALCPCMASLVLIAHCEFASAFRLFMPICSSALHFHRAVVNLLTPSYDLRYLA